MKKTYIYLLAFVLSFSAVSCEDWMNIDPAGKQNTTNYWQNAGEVEAVLGTAYLNMRKAITNKTFVYWGEMRGNGLGIIEGSAYQESRIIGKKEEVSERMKRENSNRERGK